MLDTLVEARIPGLQYMKIRPARDVKFRWFELSVYEHGDCFDLAGTVYRCNQVDLIVDRKVTELKAYEQYVEDKCSDITTT